MKTGCDNNPQQHAISCLFLLPSLGFMHQILPLSFKTQAEYIYQDLVLSIKLAELEPIINLSQALTM